jgi:hypothetical protein
MGRISINRNNDWHVQHDRQDIRSWLVKDAEGNRLGHVSDLIADTDRKLVETIVLDNGEEYPASEVDLDHDDRTVFLSGVHGATRHEADATSERATYSDAAIRERTEGEASGFAQHEPTFREHYRETYGDAEGDFSRYHPAYRLGYDYATAPQHSDRSWGDLKSEIRADYERQYGEGTWSRVKDAVHHAFERARRTTSTKSHSS